MTTRRHFIRATAAAGLSAAVPALAENDEPRIILRPSERPTGIPTMWLGAMTPTSAVVKTKLPPGTRARLYVREVGGAPLTFEPETPADPRSNVATFRLHGLRADATHACTLEVNGRPSYHPPGVFRTFPIAGAPASFRFAFGSCARTGSQHAVFNTIRSHEPSLFLHLGDFHYENITRPDPRLYRAAWDTVLSSSTQGPLYRDVPFAYAWDDHDFGPNGSDARSPSRDIARAVYREYAPHYPLPGDGAIYHAFSIARARFILCDLRSERSPAKRPDGPEKTLLGPAQKAWLKRELTESARTHALVFLISSVPWIGEKTGGDSWASYQHERRELANFIAAQRIKNLCILCGDAHMLAADDGHESRYHDGDTEAAPIPVLHGSALDQSGSIKGGPYSHGTHAAESGEGCFGLIEITDDGQRIAVRYTGRNQDDEVLVALSFEM